MSFRIAIPAPVLTGRASTLPPNELSYSHLISNLCLTFWWFFLSFSAFVGKVQRNLPDNSTKNTTRYLVSISKILKNTNGSLSVGTAIISVPHGKTPGCPCPSLPKVTFFLMGQVEINPIDGQAKVDITVKQSTVVQRMNNKDYIEKLKKKCAAYFDLTKFEWFFSAFQHQE